MDVANLIAPEVYNLTSDMEQYAVSEDKLALKWKNENGESREITYKELFQKANRAANALTKLGLKKQDRVLIMMPRLIDTYAIYIACLKAGLVVIPSSEMLRKKDLVYRLNHGEAKAVISYHQFIDQLDGVEEEAPGLNAKLIVGGEAEGWKSLDQMMDQESDSFDASQTNREDMAFMSYTSGTTGQPKGVVHSHGWAYAHLRTSAKSWMDIEEGDTVWATAGPGWQKWIWSPFISTLGRGATGFVYNGKFEPTSYLQLLQENEVNVLCCTPTEYRLMAKVDNLDKYKLPHLRSAVSAGEPLNREVIDTFKRHFNIDVRDGYGQTENTLLVGVVKGMEIKAGSMGKPTPGNKVEIINEDGEPVKPGEVGDIAVHKDVPALFKYYYKDDERTKMAFRGDYYLTGDKASKDEDGYFWFEGRGDDIIISSGYTIGPFEVEDALVKHPVVKECAVVASPDEIRGNVVKAFIVLKDTVDSSNPDLIPELQDHVKKLTAPYKYPRKIEFVEELPKTTSGKIRRIELRKQELKTQPS
ncbi:acyl-CoA synthetase MbcS [Pseudalkalibacillus caeni]|uniref:Acyl--CoA ligase n=1 Tax=Exobacillus caeni TaxID=2574798 RepID=A0A5R9F7T9_9BACL|nr:acyl--CoA ligase [Pseudalkalibacillus caeni]TLS39101.1 acyl--CoA ligase [Pseudalkalibacillus caeni]